MSNRPYDLASVADLAAQRLATIAGRARTLARGVGLLALAAGALAYAVGLFVFPSSWRPIWAIAGILVCGLPAFAVFAAARRLKRVRQTVSETAAELRTLVNDRTILSALTEVVDRDQGHEKTTPLIKLGKELVNLRKALADRKDQLVNAWQTVTALTTLPGLVALGTLGTFALLAFSAIAVVVRLVLLGD